MENKPIIQWDELYQSFLQKLQELRQSQSVTILLAQEAVDIAINYLHDLKEFIIAHPFASVDEEIRFFKHYKPKFHSQLIYYNKIFNIEIKKPTAGKHSEQHYYQRQLLRINMFLENNQDMYQYFRSNSTLLDDKYFVRGQAIVQRLYHHRHPDSDPQFTTSKDYVISQIMACEMLSQYLQAAIDRLQGMNVGVTASPVKQKTLYWTFSKTDFVQFIYGLKAVGCINNGNVTLKELFEHFGPFLNIEVSNTSRVWQEVLSQYKPFHSFFDKTIMRLKEENDKR